MGFRRPSVLSAFFAAASAAAAPAMPMGFETQTTNATGRTWRETGILSQPYAMATATLRSSMLGQGYGIVHDIDEGPNATRSLQLWRRADEDVVLMLWQENLYTTGVAWGLSARGDAGPEKEPFAESGAGADGAAARAPAVLVSHAESAEARAPAVLGFHAEFAAAAEAENAGITPEEE